MGLFSNMWTSKAALNTLKLSRLENKKTSDVPQAHAYTFILF